MTNDLINLRSDMSPVTNDLARVAAGRVLGPGQTVIWNTNTAGEIQWNRDGTFSVQISPRGDEENLGEIWQRYNSWFGAPGALGAPRAPEAPRAPGAPEEPQRVNCRWIDNLR